MSSSPFSKQKPRRSPARDAATAPPAKYYRSGQLSDKAASPFKPKPKVKKSAVRKFLFGIADTMLIVLLLIGLVYSMLVRPNPKVITTSNVYHAVAVYQEAAIKQFQQLKNRNKVSLDETGIVNALQAEFPEIASASVELPLFGETPILHLNISAPSFVLASGGKAYIVDSQGVVVGEATDFPAVKNLPQVIDQSGFGVKIGSQTLSADNVAFINTLVAEAKQANVAIASLTLPSLAQELDLRTSDRGYYVKFFLGGDAAQQSGQFLAARHDFDQSGNQPSQYLDVRVAGKIYYK